MRFISFVSALLSSVFLLMACSEAPTTQSMAEQRRPVKLFEVSEQASQITSSFPGLIENNNLTELSFVRGGRVVEFSMKEAQQFKQGDVIARLDQRELRQAVAKAESQYQVARDEYARMAKLAKSGAISKSSLQQKRTEKDLALVSLEGAKEALKDSVLTAPFDGVVAQTFIEQDQVVAGGEKIAILIGSGKLEASINVPAAFLANLYRNSHDGELLKSRILTHSTHTTLNQGIVAQFKEATLVADPLTQTYELTFEFEAPKEHLLLPGMSVLVELVVPELNAIKRLSIPIDAIASDSEGTFVWRLQPDSMTVSKQRISLQEQLGETIEVLEGLSPGDKIVSAGIGQLAEGMNVREWESR